MVEVLAAVNFGNINVCPAGQTSPPPCNQTLTLNYNVSGSTTFGTPVMIPKAVCCSSPSNPDYSINSGTCTGTVAGGSSCSVSLTFNPSAPGVRAGAVQLDDNQGNTLVSTLVSGLGNGPAAAFSPSAVTLVGNLYLVPFGMAVDAADDIYATDQYRQDIAEQSACCGGFGLNTGSVQNLPNPTGIAVDGNDNVFFVEQNVGVFEIPGSSGTPIPIGSGLSDAAGLTVDGADNLFVTESSNNQVVEITAAGLQTVVNISGGFTLNNPAGIAVDAADNLFVVDSGNNRVVEIPANGSSPSVVNTGSYQLSSPWGVGLDAAEDVYIADTNNARVIEVPPVGSPFLVNTGSYGLSNAIHGVAVDGAGQVFIADANYGQMVQVEVPQAQGLSFATTNVGSSSTPQTVTLQNVGNQPLVLSSFAVSLNFTIVPSGGTDCTQGGSLSPGAICEVAVEFAPTTGGPLTGTLTFNDNALNNAVASQTVSLSGTAPQFSQVITFITPPPPTAKSGGSFTVAASGGGSGNPVIFSVGAGSVCTLAPPATYTMNSGTGNCYVVANQAAGGLYTAAAQVTDTVVAVHTVTKVAPTVTFTGAPSSAAYLSTFTVATTQNSGVTPTITSTTGSVCSVGTVNNVPDTVTMKKGTGICAVKASWATDTYYLAASLTQSVTASLLGTSTTITNTIPQTAHPLKVEVYFTVSNGTATAVTGSVTVSASPGGQTCTGTVTAGKCLLTFTAAGPETLTGVYAGNSNDGTSTSNPYSLTVQ